MTMPYGTAPQPYAARPAPTGPHSRAAARLALLSLLAAVAFALAYLVGVRTVAGQRVDNALLAGQEYDVQTRTEAAWDLLGRFTVGAIALAVLVTVAVPLLRRRPRLALASGAVIVLSGAANELLKEYLLPRPALVEAPAYLLQNSFPSGHVTLATAAGAGLVLAVPHRLRGSVAVGAGLFAAVVGSATMRAAWHRLSDLVGSYLLVLAVAAGVAAVLAVWRPPAPPGPPPLRGPSGRWRSVLASVLDVSSALATSVAVLVGVAGVALALGPLLATLLRGDLEVAGTDTLELVALGGWLTLLSAAALAAVWAARSPRRHVFRPAASALTAAGVLAAVAGAAVLYATWHEVTLGSPGEVSLLWAYRLGVFFGVGVCFLSFAALLVAIGPTELDPLDPLDLHGGPGAVPVRRS